MAPARHIAERSAERSEPANYRWAIGGTVIAAGLALAGFGLNVTGLPSWLNLSGTDGAPSTSSTSPGPQRAALITQTDETQRRAEQAKRRAEDADVIQRWSGRTGETLRDCPKGCPELVVVPHDEFMMGSPENEFGFEIRSDERPYHSVTIGRPFAVGKFEVTFAEWEACAAEGGCRHRPDDRSWGRGRRPVINVSWNDITTDYLPWLSRKAGKTYRLLTEAEWEYAARAGTTSTFSTGRMITAAQANFDGRSQYNGSPRGAARGRTVEVGTFKPNAFGLFDMHGNVWEWVQDCRHQDGKTYATSYAGAPVDGSARFSANCEVRATRGGAWNFAPHNLRSAERGGGEPSSRDDNLGFRVARAL